MDHRASSIFLWKGRLMATVRTLTIASMAAPGWVRINEVANTDIQFSAICGGSLKVTRSSDGKRYSWETDTDHIRIFIKMSGPTDLPFITHTSDGAGWFMLDGFPQIPLRRTEPETAQPETQKTNAW
jgi:hypothetical protein